MITAKQIIDPQIPILEEDFTIEQALRWMDENRVNELPVLVNGEFKGLVNETQLLDIEDQATFIMPALSHWNISPEDHFFTMIHQMSEHQSSIAVVLDQNKKYLGCVTREDLVDAMSQLTSAHLEGGVLLMEMHPRDYTLQQIVRIIEENNAKVVALFSYQNDRGMLELCIKMDRKDINAIVRSLERFNYRIRATFQHQDSNIDLMDRYDTLMRFLDED
jgi:acetoin utilization protein AcuB